MKGSRPLSDDELKAVLASFKGPWALRNRALVVLGVKTGFRISELLSLKVADVFQYGKIADQVTVARCHMKKKRESRTVPLHHTAKEYLEAWLNRPRSSDPDAYLFCGKRGPMKPITRSQGWRVIKEASRALQLSGKISTHSMRKSFARTMWEKLDHNLIDTQHALGHASPSSTASYLAHDDGKINSAILDD